MPDYIPRSDSDFTTWQTNFLNELLPPISMN